MNRPLVLIATLCAVSVPALAGRPLSVDDANTNDAGAGHVEFWVAHAPGSTVTVVAPAYAPVESIEFAVAYARARGDESGSGTVQAKWRITPAQEAGCNLGASLGLVRTGGADGHFVNALLSCNHQGAGSLHVNLGRSRAPAEHGVATWGAALEREFGAVTPHVEWFGSQHSRPTLQLGARGRVAQDWQLDGTVGRQGGRTLWSLGMKYQF